MDRQTRGGRRRAQAFVSRTRLAVQRADDLAPAAFEDEPAAAGPSGAPGAAAPPPAAPAAGAPEAAGGAAAAAPAANPHADLLGDLLDLDVPAPASAHPPAGAYAGNGAPLLAARTAQAVRCEAPVGRPGQGSGEAASASARPGAGRRWVRQPACCAARRRP